MGEGVSILGTVTKKCYVKQEGERLFKIILTQGLNRQIRRMTEALDYKVVALTRVRIMNITLKGLPKGKWRYFSPAEIEQVNDMIAQNSKAGNEDGMGE